MNELQKVIEQAAASRGYSISMNDTFSTGIVIAGLIIAVLVCFFGLKLKRVLCIIAATLVGVLCAGGAMLFFDISDMTGMIIAIIGVLFLIALSMVFIRFGVFLLMLSYVSLMGAIIFVDASPLTVAICAGVAFLVAILSAIFMDPFIIILTALLGGIQGGQLLGFLLGERDNLILIYTSFAVIAVIGMIIQFMMHSRKIIAKEKGRATRISEEESMETEVEKARLILENYETDSEDDEYLDE